MSKLTKKYETRLETAPVNEIQEILDAKLEATAPESVVDYISLAIDNLNSTIYRVKNAQKELNKIKKDAELQIENIKVGSSKWLSDVGVEKLNGDIVSSIKVVKKAPSVTLKVTNEDTLINAGYFKTVLDKTAVKNAIENGIDVDGAELETTYDEDSITIYHKRGA